MSEGGGNGGMRHTRQKERLTLAPGSSDGHSDTVWMVFRRRRDNSPRSRRLVTAPLKVNLAGVNVFAS